MCNSYDIVKKKQNRYAGYTEKLKQNMYKILKFRNPTDHQINLCFKVAT